MTRLILTVGALMTAIAVGATTPDGLRLPGKSISTSLPKTGTCGDAPLSQPSSPACHKAPSRADGVFYESFEYDNAPYYWQEATADLEWLPQGWSRMSDSAVEEPIDRWFAYPLQTYTFIPATDGAYTMAVLYNSDYKDEWLITPELTIADSQYLTFGWYTLPLYFWIVDQNHVDFENATFKRREIAATLQVMISADGGEWAELKDMSEDFASMDFAQLVDYDPGHLMTAKLSLGDYARHTVRIAFRYVGSDGNSIFIDGVSVNNGIDRLDVMYHAPMGTQYAGGTVDGQIFDLGYMLQPVGTELTWTNVSSNPIATDYSWSCDGLPVTAQDADELTVSLPIPSVTAKAPFVTYPSPTLRASSPGTRDTEYTDRAQIMAGGKVQISDSIYGLLPFDVVNNGIMTYTVEPVDFGHDGIPIFGYSEDTDAWWRLYTCGGKEENLDHIPYAYVSGVINAIIPSEQAMVVNGAWLYAKGVIHDNARLKCEIYSLDEDGAFDRVVASASITGRDAQVFDTSMNMYYYSLPFVFDAPAVLDREGTDGGMYAVMVSGFHDGGVEYFAPMMQQRPNAFEECYGFYQIEYAFEREHNVGLSFVAFHENDLGPMYDAFAINLDAEYPWLECVDTDIDIEDGVSVRLNSYYGANLLTVTLADGSPLPDWLVVKGRGRFDNAVLTCTVKEEGNTIDQDLLVSGPGVQTLIKVNGVTAPDDPVIADIEGEWRWTTYDMFADREIDHKVMITKADGKDGDITIADLLKPGLTLPATYDAATRTITVPYTDLGEAYEEGVQAAFASFYYTLDDEGSLVDIYPARDMALTLTYDEEEGRFANAEAIYGIVTCVDGVPSADMDQWLMLLNQAYVVYDPEPEDITDDPADFVEAGLAEIQDGWIYPAHGIDPSLYPWVVTLERSVKDEGVYRLVNPYGADYKHSVATASEPGYIRFNLADTRVPYIYPNVYSGYQHPQLGRIYLYDRNGHLIVNLGERADVYYLTMAHDASTLSTYDAATRTITIPAPMLGVPGHKAEGLSWTQLTDGGSTPTGAPARIRIISDNTGIDSVSADRTEVEYYNLQGMRVERPSGLCIMRQGNETRKVLR